jgi:hypothetical protein
MLFQGILGKKLERPHFNQLAGHGGMYLQSSYEGSINSRTAVQIGLGKKHKTLSTKILMQKGLKAWLKG